MLVMTPNGRGEQPRAIECEHAVCSTAKLGCAGIRAMVVSGQPRMDPAEETQDERVDHRRFVVAVLWQLSNRLDLLASSMLYPSQYP